MEILLQRDQLSNGVVLLHVARAVCAAHSWILSDLLVRATGTGTLSTVRSARTHAYVRRIVRSGLAVNRSLG
jgi:hypothetical protein